MEIKRSGEPILSGVRPTLCGMALVRQPLGSRIIRSAGYDPEAQVLELEFLSGGVYLPTEVLRQHQGTPEPALRLAVEASDGGKMLTPREIGLTARQADVLALLVQGKPNKLICRELDVAEGTVKIHVTAILKALNVTNRTQAVIAVGKLKLQLRQI